MLPVRRRRSPKWAILPALLSLSALGGSLGGMLSTLGTGRLIAAYGYVPVFTALSVLHLTAFGCLLVAMRRRPTSPAAP